MKIEGFKDTIEWYNQNAKKYADSSEKGYSMDEIKEFESYMPHNGLILDAGCGSGRDSALFAEKYTVIGLDMSEGLIAGAKKRYSKPNFVVGDFLSLDFEDAYFDGIWAHASLVHLETTEDVKKALSEFNRVLKQNGVLHVLVKAQTGDKKTAVVSDSLSGHDRFFQYFTKGEVEQLLVEQGFSLLKSEQYRESDKTPTGRPEVEWIYTLSKKI